jgi:hypothetical protein
MPAVMEQLELAEKAASTAEALETVSEFTKAMQRHAPSREAKERSRELRDRILELLKAVNAISAEDMAELAATTSFSAADLQAALSELPQRKVIKGTPRTITTAFNPLVAGHKLREQLATAEGGAWSGLDLQKQFKLSPAVLHRRRKEHRIVYWRDAQHDFHYPKWQFTPAGALLPGLQEILELFGSDDEWRVIRYFLTPKRSLNNQRPMDLLQQGKSGQVIAHATTHAAENTW